MARRLEPRRSDNKNLRRQRAVDRPAHTPMLETPVESNVQRSVSGWYYHPRMRALSGARGTTRWSTPVHLLSSLNPIGGACVKENRLAVEGETRRSVEKTHGRKVPGVESLGGPDFDREAARGDRTSREARCRLPSSARSAPQTSPDKAEKRGSETRHYMACDESLRCSKRLGSLRHELARDATSPPKSLEV